MADGFSCWVRWEDRASLADLKYPGVYVLALSQNDIVGKRFTWIPEIVYVGMTNSVGGLRARLRQFDRTVAGVANSHGGAQRFRFKHPNYGAVLPSMYVAACPFPCDAKSLLPDDLRVMGDVARHEYECMARYVEAFGELPEFNDKKRSPKS